MAQVDPIFLPSKGGPQNLGITGNIGVAPGGNKSPLENSCSSQSLYENFWCWPDCTFLRLQKQQRLPYEKAFVFSCEFFGASGSWELLCRGQRGIPREGLWDNWRRTRPQSTGTAHPLVYQGLRSCVQTETSLTIHISSGMASEWSLTQCPNLTQSCPKYLTGVQAHPLGLRNSSPFLRQCHSTDV